MDETTGWYDEKRRKEEEVFNQATLIESRESSVSPSGQYRLDVIRYDTGPDTWPYSRGIITRLIDDKVVADVKRNYNHFPYTWVSHANSNEYLICGEDYQGYTIVDLARLTTRSYIPPEAEQGHGFCWVVVHPAPDGRTLAVDGCYWACPYEIKFYDFSDPSALPLPELGGSGTNDYDTEAVGWEDPETFVMRCTVPIRKADGVRYDALSEQEQRELDHDWSLVEGVPELVRWRRTQPA